jgi:hypothetical protein
MLVTKSVRVCALTIAYRGGKGEGAIAPVAEKMKKFS